MNGVLNIYKEKGYTSFDVVAKLRGILHMRKIGHTGTLDPNAEGVLPVCIGNATSLCEILTEKTKTYEAVIKFGLVTDTQDTTGKVIEEHPVDFTKEAVYHVIRTFVGEYDQIPPMYSAIKVNGKRLYELAREGKEIERKPRRITIYSIDILDQLENDEITIRVNCSKGTYIRTLCHDIGEKLLCGACMKSLIRIQSGQFDLKDSLKLKEIEKLAEEGRINEVLISTEDIVSFKKINIRAEYEKFLKNGNKLTPDQVSGLDCTINQAEDAELFKVYDTESRFSAIYRYDLNKGEFRPYKMFL